MFIINGGTKQPKGNGMTNYKNINQHRRGADHPADGFLTGLGTLIVIGLLLFYVLALVPQ